jgi:hypothetical protein
MINQVTIPRIKRGINELRASIFPPDRSTFQAPGREFVHSSGQDLASVNQSMLTTIKVVNLEAAQSCYRSAQTTRLVNFSSTYREGISREQRITPKRLGSSFSDFMERFHEFE